MHLVGKLVSVLLLVLIGALVLVTLVLIAYPLLAHLAARYFQ